MVRECAANHAPRREVQLHGIYAIILDGAGLTFREEPMENPDRLPGVNPKVLWIIAINTGLWGVVYLAMVSIWPGQPTRPHIAIERMHDPQLATVVNRPRVLSRARHIAKAKRKRRGQTLAARVFDPSRSVN
jgi:hypothetical protein